MRRAERTRVAAPNGEFPDFPDLDEVACTDCGKSERNGFEPAHGRGAAARAVFLLRYAGVITAAELPPDRFDILLAWHDQEAVSEWERHRNAAIFARPGQPQPVYRPP